MNEATCVICGEAVPAVAQQSHLSLRHPGPFKFHHDGREYTTDKPSMTVAELKRLVCCDPSHFLYDENDICYTDGQALDLTREQWLYSIPPATF